MFCGRSPHRDKEKERRMTPSEYGEGRSLAHDRMQADVLDWMRENGRQIRTIKHHGTVVELHRHGPWPECPLKVKGALRGFVDLLERWSSKEAKDSNGRMFFVSQYIAYEIKPRLTTIGGLIRQMRAEELLIEQAFGDGTSRTSAVVIPVINHDDPELPLLRRLWAGPVALWNAEERALT
jgi:hypothetical protein